MTTTHLYHDRYQIYAFYFKDITNMFSARQTESNMRSTFSHQKYISALRF